MPPVTGSMMSAVVGHCGQALGTQSCDWAARRRFMAPDMRMPPAMAIPAQTKPASAPMRNADWFTFRPVPSYPKCGARNGALVVRCAHFEALGGSSFVGPADSCAIAVHAPQGLDFSPDPR